jgi:hypothetical protein
MPENIIENLRTTKHLKLNVNYMPVSWTFGIKIAIMWLGALRSYVTTTW